jgi:hypothetical protein
MVTFFGKYLLEGRHVKGVEIITAQIELRWPVAAWVLGAHLYAILVPIALCVAVNHHWQYLVEQTYNPFLFYVAAGLWCAGSAFETAQNAIDRWYLTPECASAEGIGFVDMLAFWFMTAGQAVVAVAIGGEAGWVWAVAVLAVLAYPLFYVMQKLMFAPMAAVGLITAVLGYLAFGDPVIFLSLLLAQATLFFFSALLATGAQAMHGFTTAFASSGVWFLVWAIHNGDNDSQMSWIFVIAVVIAAIGLRFLLWPVLEKLPASPRVVRGRVGEV